MLRKATLLSAVAGLALLASPARADVNLLGDVDKDVDIYIWEGVFKLKLAGFLVLIIDQPEKVAKSQAIFNQRNENNTACENCAEKLDLIQGSILSNNGITSVNQSTGNSNNQGTVISIAWSNVVTEPPPPPPPGGGDPNGNTGHANSQVAGEQILSGNTIHTVNVPFRDAELRASVNSNIGITAVNQAAGNINNQANAVSIAFTLYNGVALSDTALGQWNTGNNPATEAGVSKFAYAENSIQLNRGITQVNQAAGILANQSNVVSIAATGLAQ